MILLGLCIAEAMICCRLLFVHIPKNIALASLKTVCCIEFELSMCSVAFISNCVHQHNVWFIVKDSTIGLSEDLIEPKPIENYKITKIVRAL